LEGAQDSTRREDSSVWLAAAEIMSSMRILFALPGLHRYDRGAEIAFISIASELARSGDVVTLIGSGAHRAETPYRFLHVPSIRREKFEHFPSIPVLRSEYAYEELTFVPGLLRNYRPFDYDVTVTCSYPFTNWILRRRLLGRSSRPPHVFVTQNGDWPAQSNHSEFRFFGCDGLVCTNPDFYERNRNRWRCRLIPNGVDCSKFFPASADRREFGLPTDRLVILMVSALIASKRVEAGVRAVSTVPDAHLVVAGDGPLRASIDSIAAELLPGRFTRLSVPPERMPALYRSADVFLHLSKEEAFGNVFLEAMACGLPIVGHDSQRLRWIAGGDEFLLDTENAAEVARHIELASRIPAAERVQRSTRAAKFSWSKIAESYRRFLREVTTSGPETKYK
jgi:glycosyltransferase involved in cell wall biosynthesis